MSFPQVSSLRPPLARRLCAGLLLLVLSVSASAGQYAVTYTGGKWHSAGPTGETGGDIDHGPSGASYTAYTGGAVPPSGSVTVGPGSASCDETITAHFVWQPANANDPPPPSVVVKETAHASWEGSSGGCSTGFDVSTGGHAGSDANATGVRYTVHSGASFDVSATPTANVTAGGFLFSGSCSVGYSATCASVVLSIAGTTKIGNSNELKVLIGQRQTATISVEGGYQLKNKVWSVAGPKTFGKVIEGASHPALVPGTITPSPTDTYRETRKYDLPIVIDEPNHDSASFYQAKNGLEIVTCVADLCDAGGAVLASLAVERRATVWVPTYELTLTPGHTTLSQTGGRVHVGTAGPGMKFHFWAETPADFAVGGSYGRVAECQRAKVDYTILPSPPYERVCTTRTAGGAAEFWLDTAYPYRDTIEAHEYWADDTDGPAFDFFADASSVTVAFDFEMSCIYLPPGDSVYVPLKEQDWSWRPTVTKTGTVWSASGNPTASTISYYDLLKVSWDDVAQGALLPHYYVIP